MPDGDVCPPPPCLQLLSVRAKDAVCDAIRDARGTKPAPPEPGRVADLPLYCTAYHDRLSIYRDMSGASLHRRAASACLVAVGACCWDDSRQAWAVQAEHHSGGHCGVCIHVGAPFCPCCPPLQARLPAGHAPSLAERGSRGGHPAAGRLAPGVPAGGRGCGRGPRGGVRARCRARAAGGLAGGLGTRRVDQAHALCGPPPTAWLALPGGDGRCSGLPRGGSGTYDVHFLLQASPGPEPQAPSCPACSAGRPHVRQRHLPHRGRPHGHRRGAWQLPPLVALHAGGCRQGRAWRSAS